MPRFSEIVMDHFLAPRNAGAMDTPDGIGNADVGGRAPRMRIYVRLADQRIEQATFESFGCGAAIAAASMLTELVTGKTADDCRALKEQELYDALGGLPTEKRFCCGLALWALNNALDDAAERASGAADEDTRDTRES